MREPFAKCLKGGGKLLLHDPLILVLLVVGPETLPGQRSTQEVKVHVSKALQIVTARLFNPKVGVDRCITSGARQRFVLSVLDMFAISADVSFCKSEVDNVNLMSE